METLDDARRLVNGIYSPGGADALVQVLGFIMPSLALDNAALAALGIEGLVTAPRICLGVGALRALVFRAAGGSELREQLTNIARRMSQRAPQFLWVLVALEPASDSMTIAVWQLHGNAIRISALITRCGAIPDSDAETLCSLCAACTAENDVVRYLRWTDILGRDSITSRFFGALRSSIDGLADSLPATVPRPDAKAIALLTTSRLVFLSFVEAKGWLDRNHGFLENGFTQCMSSTGGYQRNILEPLFFGTLNTRLRDRAPCARQFGRIPFLNGGLFARTALERIHRHARFTDDALGNLFGDVLVRYRFTPAEEASEWTQAAVDPEILGRVFEAVMESGDRKRDGVFYTPRRYVDRVSTLALSATLESHGLDAASAIRIANGEVPEGGDRARVFAAAFSVTILDPACGSGAFLVHALERLARIRQNAGDTLTPADTRRDVLTRSIFGVDANPTAVWLCELRLWLSVVMDSGETDPMKVTPLPNLDRNIRIGDSLSGNDFANGQRIATTRSITMLRNRYARSSGKRKISLARSLDGAERERAVAVTDSALASLRHRRRDCVAVVRTRDLFQARQRPNAAIRQHLRGLRAEIRSLERRRKLVLSGSRPAFEYSIHFADVADSGGFDIILANPPWVRLHHIPAEDRAGYREQFDVMRSSAWTDGALGAKASPGFAGQVDMAALFVERSIGLLAPGGTLGCLLPSKLWRSLAGGGVRHLLLSRTRLHALEDHDDRASGFDAAVYPSVLVTRVSRLQATVGEHCLDVSVGQASLSRRWATRQSSLAFDDSTGSPWILLPPDCRDAFDALKRIGPPLFESRLGRPRLGVKSGCNEAFIVLKAGPDAEAGELSAIQRGARSGSVERDLLRPLVRGETLTPWRIARNEERILWTHAPDGSALRSLPDGVRSWLLPWRTRLEARSDSRSARWWSLFRTEAACNASPRVVWADFGLRPRAAVIDAGDPTVPLNTCYSVACPGHADALALAAILNSRVAAAWLGAIAEPAKGSYKRYLGWTVSRLPVPADWERACNVLGDLASEARRGHTPSCATLDRAVLDAYGLSPRTFAPLIEWDAARDA